MELTLGGLDTVVVPTDGSGGPTTFVCDGPCDIDIDITLPGVFQRCEDLAPPDLIVPPSVIRGQRATLGTLHATPSCATNRNWKFTAVDGIVTNRTSNPGSNLWPGHMVASGTVSVDVRKGGRDYHLERTITVNPRDGWAYQVPDPEEKVNGTEPRTTILDPPRPDAAGKIYLGKNTADVRYQFDPAQVTAGPNTGYSFVISRSTAEQHRPKYFWTASPALFTPSSPYYAAFAAANCGDYSSSKPYGFGLAAEIRANVERHESGAIQSHYVFFADALGAETNNPGLIMESYVRKMPAPSLGTELVDFLEPKIATIHEARGVEPCDPSEVNYNGACQFRGFVNTVDPVTFQFAACPRP